MNKYGILFLAFIIFIVYMTLRFQIDAAYDAQKACEAHGMKSTIAASNRSRVFTNSRFCVDLKTNQVYLFDIH